MVITCLLEMKTYEMTVRQKIQFFNKYISFNSYSLSFHRLNKERVFIPFQRNNELGNSVSETEILLFNEHNILFFVNYFSIEEKNKNSGIFHSDMK